MPAPRWKPHPHSTKGFSFAGDALKKAWKALHRGDCEPYPREAPVLEAWRLFHQGRFGEAVAAGLAAGRGGLAAANKAQGIYADGVETDDKARLALFEEVMRRAEAQARSEPGNPNAHYLYAYAAGRYSQRISVAKALAQGSAGGCAPPSGGPSSCSRSTPRPTSPWAPSTPRSSTRWARRWAV